jgi:hypothetical protein
MLNLIEELKRKQSFVLFCQTIPMPILNWILKTKILSIFGQINCALHLSCGTSLKIGNLFTTFEIYFMHFHI